MPHEAYGAESTQYLNNYMWKIEDRIPTSYAKLWGMFEGRTAEYFQSIKIRASATSTGKEPKTNFLTENRERSNYESLDCARRLETVEDPAGDYKAILVR